MNAELRGRHVKALLVLSLAISHFWVWKTRIPTINKRRLRVGISLPKMCFIIQNPAVGLTMEHIKKNTQPKPMFAARRHTQTKCVFPQSRGESCVHRSKVWRKFVIKKSPFAIAIESRKFAVLYGNLLCAFLPQINSFMICRVVTWLWGRVFVWLSATHCSPTHVGKSYRGLLIDVGLKANFHE